jgi:hypothetical protein
MSKPVCWSLAAILLLAVTQSVWAKQTRYISRAELYESQARRYVADRTRTVVPRTQFVQPRAVYVNAAPTRQRVADRDVSSALVVSNASYHDARQVTVVEEVAPPGGDLVHDDIVGDPESARVPSNDAKAAQYAGYSAYHAPRSTTRVVYRGYPVAYHSPYVHRSYAHYPSHYRSPGYCSQPTYRVGVHYSSGYRHHGYGHGYRHRGYGHYGHRGYGSGYYGHRGRGHYRHHGSTWGVSFHVRF